MSDNIHSPLFSGTTDSDTKPEFVSIFGGDPSDFSPDTLTTQDFPTFAGHVRDVFVISQDITWTVGATGDYATINDAWTEFLKFRVMAQVTLTLAIQEGESQTVPSLAYHPDSKSVVITSVNAPTTRIDRASLQAITEAGDLATARTFNDTAISNHYKASISFVGSINFNENCLNFKALHINGNLETTSSYNEPLLSSKVKFDLCVFHSSGNRQLIIYGNIELDLTSSIFLFNNGSDECIHLRFSVNSTTLNNAPKVHMGDVLNASGVRMQNGSEFNLVDKNWEDSGRINYVLAATNGGFDLYKSVKIDLSYSTIKNYSGVWGFISIFSDSNLKCIETTFDNVQVTTPSSFRYTIFNSGGNCDLSGAIFDGCHGIINTSDDGSTTCRDISVVNSLGGSQFRAVNGGKNVAIGSTNSGLSMTPSLGIVTNQAVNLQ